MFEREPIDCRFVFMINGGTGKNVTVDYLTVDLFLVNRREQLSAGRLDVDLSL
jgi:hypothetical protein